MMKGMHDVIIVGGGIAGLTCGCYLAKEGLKVILFEKHDKPGGYCTSFQHKGYKFDVGVHYLGSCREGGQISRIIKDFSLNVKFDRFDPTDKIILPDNIIYIHNNIKDTIEEFKKNFIKEDKNIDSFFRLILERDFLTVYSKIRRLTFRDLLDKFFSDEKIKSALSVLLGNIGLPSCRIAAMTAVTLFKEFILDGGYYPHGGVQVFPDALLERFKEYGGQIRLNTTVKKIVVDDGEVMSVVFDDNCVINSSFVVVAGDVTNTFVNLIDKETEEKNKVNKLEPSASAIVVYLGLKVDLAKIIKDHCSTWYFSTYDVDGCYSRLSKNIVDRNMTDYIICTFPSLHDRSLGSSGKSSMAIFNGAFYEDKNFWNKRGGRIAEIMINKAEKIVPNLSKIIDAKIIGVPQTFEKYTFNRQGALYGWSSLMNQIEGDTFAQMTSVKGLIVAGHWCTHGLGQGGVSVSAYSGKRASKEVMKALKAKSKR